MCINLQSEVNDIEVENLLKYFNSQSTVENDEKIAIMERAIKWLHICKDLEYFLNPNPPASIVFSVSSFSPNCALHSDKQVLQNEQTLIYP